MTFDHRYTRGFLLNQKFTAVAITKSVVRLFSWKKGLGLLWARSFRVLRLTYCNEPFDPFAPDSRECSNEHGRTIFESGVQAQCCVTHHHSALSIAAREAVGIPQSSEICSAGQKNLLVSFFNKLFQGLLIITMMSTNLTIAALEQKYIELLQMKIAALENPTNAAGSTSASELVWELLHHWH